MSNREAPVKRLYKAFAAAGRFVCAAVLRVISAAWSIAADVLLLAGCAFIAWAAFEISRPLGLAVTGACLIALAVIIAGARRRRK
jgi:hypothetical protein